MKVNIFILDQYANLCTQVKIAMDTEDILPHVHQRLLDFYDELPLAKDYYGVERSNFAELADRYRGQRVLKRKPAHCLSVMYQTIGPPPPKRVATAQPTTPHDEWEVEEERRDSTGDFPLPGEVLLEFIHLQNQ